MKKNLTSKRLCLACVMAASLITGMLSGCSSADSSSEGTVSSAASDPGSPDPSGSMSESTPAIADPRSLEDGVYGIPVALSGGTGKASLASPARMTVDGGRITVTFLWSSKNYDYMRIGDTQYLPVSPAGEPSAFEIPLTELSAEMTVYADTVAMSTPHEIEYTVTFDLDAITAGEPIPSVAGTDAASESSGTSSGYSDAPGSDAASKADSDSSGRTLGELEHDIPDWFDAVSSMELEYAHEYAVDYDAEQRAYITIGTDQHFLLLPEDMQAPDGITDDVILIQQPLDSIYAASSSTLDLFDKCSAMNRITLVSSEYNSWTIQSVRDGMDRGDIAFVGKYSEPDFERIAASDVDFILENNMIYHSPSTLEKLRELGFTVMIERMSYESHPLGRAEWIRLIGLLTGCSDRADEVFASLKSRFEANIASETSSKTVAFFYISTSGSAVIRLPGDYISKMIRLAGGNYVFDGIETENTTKATMNLEMEAFYSAARDADILIYNNSIDSSVRDMDGLLAKSPLLADFKAVKNKNVWCTGENVYQQVTSVADLMEDFHSVIFDDADGADTLSCLTRLN